MADLNRIIIGQSGGPTPVIDWTVAGALAAVKEAGIEMLGAINGLEGILHGDVKGNIVDLTSLNPMQFVHNGPGSGLKTTRIKPKEDQYKVIVENLNKLKVDGIVYVGGNDSADQLLGAEQRPVVALSELEDRDDAWMIEARDQPHLTEESDSCGTRGRIVRRLRERDQLLECHLAADDLVPSGANDALATPAQLVQSGVLPRALHRDLRRRGGTGGRLH